MSPMPGEGLDDGPLDQGRGSLRDWQLHQACHRPPGVGGGGGSPNAKKGAVNRRKRKWMLGGPKTSNVHQRQSLPTVYAEVSWGSVAKDSEAPLEVEHKLG